MQREENILLSLHPNSAEDTKMKTAIHFFALTAVLAGAAAAAITPSGAKPIVSHQSASATMPIPVCAPGLPGCPNATATR
jgi:hypothetical protein